MIIFDSTFLVDIMKSSKNFKQKKANLMLQELIDTEEPIATTFVNVFEMYKGICRSDNKKSAQLELDRTLARISVIGFDEKYYREFGKLSAYLEEKGTPIGKFDELIAAIAISHNAKIVTNNTRDFARVPGLEIIPH